MNYYFHAAAESEYLESVAFYETRQAGLGASFIAEFEQAMQDIVLAPHRYRLAMKPDICRKRLNRFPYHVIFRSKNDSVQVLAVPP